MAYTGTIVKSTVMGNERVVLMDVTSDAASGSVVTGIGIIDAIAMSPISCATAGFKVKANLTTGSSVANGTIFMSSTASGDRFYLIVYGR